MGKDKTSMMGLDGQAVPLESRDAVPVEATGNIISSGIRGLATGPSIPEHAIIRNLPQSFEAACSVLNATRGECLMIVTRPGAGYVIRKTDL